MEKIHNYYLPNTLYVVMLHKGFPGGLNGKETPAMKETWVQSLGWENPLGKGMATHSSILVWRIPWTEEPSRLQSTRSQESDMT